MIALGSISIERVHSVKRLTPPLILTDYLITSYLLRRIRNISCLVWKVSIASLLRLYYIGLGGGVFGMDGDEMDDNEFMDGCLLDDGEMGFDEDGKLKSSSLHQLFC